MSKKTYVIVSLLLAAIVGLAPDVYSLFNRTVQTQDDSGTSVPQTQGYVVLFLAAALCTLTGVLAQLVACDGAILAGSLSCAAGSALGARDRVHHSDHSDPERSKDGRP
ncbi:MAG TPA: hypothetical protein VFE33_26345 [Thermoanaerobaculia bacterium]|nr:hypothetical protein [Thermoanaerobaculia bacterium]